MSTRVCAVFSYHAETPLQLRSRHSKPPLPIIPFDIVAYAYTLLWDNLSQKSSIHVIFFCTLVLGSTNVSYFISVKLSVISLFT